jgi:PAS domain S-box-containing protein
MVPHLPEAGLEAHGRGRLRLPVAHPTAEALVVLAAAFVGAALGAGAWVAAALGAGALLAGGLAVVRLRALNRELLGARRERSEWERRYRRLHDSTAVAAFRADPSGRLTSVNRGLAALLGYGSEAELLAAEFAQHGYVGPGTFEAVLQRVRRQGALENLEMRLRRFDGLTVTVQATISALWDDGGAVTEFEGTVVDLTRERLAESQRRTMERRFRSLFDSGATAMLVGNLRRATLEEANPALIALFGLRPSALPLPLERLIPADQRPLHREARAMLEVHGVAGPLAFEYLHADGRRVPVLLSAAMVEPQYGEFVAVVVDRTAEAGALRRVAQIQAVLGALLETLPTATATFERDGGLARCNHALCDWLGIAHAPVGRTLAELIGPAGDGAVQPAVTRVLAGETVSVAVAVERGGRARRLALTLVPRCSESGAVAGFLAFVRDPAGLPEPRSRGPAVQAVGAGVSADCAEGRRTA